MLKSRELLYISILEAQGLKVLSSINIQVQIAIFVVCNYQSPSSLSSVHPSTCLIKAQSA